MLNLAGADNSDCGLGTPALSMEDRVSEFYESAREDVYRFLLLRGIPPGPAQELVQEAFLRYYSALLDGQTIRHNRAWVVTVARNLGENWRAASPPSREFELDLELPANPESTSPELRLIGSERLRRLHDAVGALSPQQRQCLHLRAEGFRYREIAGILGIATSTVSEFLRRAVARLRRAVEE
jgi:RNA polymerase sigma-70 factor, ECF subfamily